MVVAPADGGEAGRRLPRRRGDAGVARDGSIAFASGMAPRRGSWDEAPPVLPTVKTGSASFAGFRFPPEVILLAVRWYRRDQLPRRSRRVTTDRSPALARTIVELLPGAHHDTTEYANNRVEADHGRLKARLRPMRGLKRDRTASVAIRGHAFMQKALRTRRRCARWSAGRCGVRRTRTCGLIPDPAAPTQSRAPVAVDATAPSDSLTMRNWDG